MKIACLTLLFIVLPHPVIADEIDIGKKLDIFYREYKNIQFENQKDEIEPLVNLDKKIRMFLKQIRNPDGHRRYWKKHYSELSLRINHFTDNFEYEGALLYKAHKINPNSKYRKYTLFTEINSDKYCWVGNPENLEVALQYLKEFPDGPFVNDVYFGLGGFHSSLYDYIRFEKKVLTSKPHAELKGYDEGGHNTLIPYIKDISKVSLEKQEEQAKTNAIKYLEIYLESEEKPVHWIKGRLVEIKEGTNQRYGIFSCPD